MLLRRRAGNELRIVPQMTSMIDVVFQLLIFFVVAFRITPPEGDLAIRLPASVGEQQVEEPTPLPLLSVRLIATPDGELAAIHCAGEVLADTAALRSRIERLVAQVPEATDELRVDLVCDQALHYHHTMAALTAVSGKRQHGHHVALVKQVRLTTP